MAAAFDGGGQAVVLCELLYRAADVRHSGGLDDQRRVFVYGRVQNEARVLVGSATGQQ